MRPDSPFSHAKAAVLLLMAAAALAGCRTLTPDSPGVQAAMDRRTEAGSFSWPPGLQEGQALTTEQCVTVALWNSPDFQTALADLGVAWSDVVKAGQIANPTLSALFPSDAKAFELAVNLPVEVLWLRPRRVEIARTDLEATAARLTQAGADLARDVRLAAANVLLVREQGRHARENAAIFDQMAGVAETREQAGDTDGVALAQAKADAALAHQESERLRYEERLATETLTGLLGMSQRSQTLVLAERRSSLPQPASVGEAIRQAIAGRADVRAAELGVVAAGQRAKLAKSEVLALTATAKFTDGAGTQPGFDLPLPLFNQNQAARVLADAQLDKAMHQLAAARHRAAADVREAMAKLAQARAVSAGWKKVLPELETALHRARTAVDEGEGQPFLALDAARRLAEARSKAAESRCRLSEAEAQLRRALGKT